MIRSRTVEALNDALERMVGVAGMARLNLPPESDAYAYIMSAVEQAQKALNAYKKDRADDTAPF